MKGGSTSRLKFQMEECKMYTQDQIDAMAAEERKIAVVGGYIIWQIGAVVVRALGVA